jgi:hypothetical protein
MSNTDPDPRPELAGDPATAKLRQLLRSAEETIVPPPQLWDQIRAPRTTAVPPVRRRWIPVAAVGAIVSVAVAAFAAGALWQSHRYPSATNQVGGHAVADSISVSLGRTGALPRGASSSCGTGSSTSSNVTTCVSVNGSGLDINFAIASATVRTSARIVQVCVHGPAGTIGCSQFESVAAGDTLSLRWSPFGAEPPGQYCANTVRRSDVGAEIEVGSYCVEVHA